MKPPAKVEKAAARGWSVIPVRLDKRPLVKEWKTYQQRQPTRAELEQWANMQPPAWAVITGQVSGLVIVDFDGPEGVETMHSLGLKPHVVTGSGGRHVYFRYPGFHVPTLNAKTKNALGEAYPGLDIRGDGGYAVFTGRNASGEYRWMRPAAELESVEILPDPLRLLLSLIPPETHSNGNGHAPAPAAVPSPRPPATNGNGRGLTPRDEWLLEQALARVGRKEGRDNTGFWLAAQLRDSRYSESEALAIGRRYVAGCPDTDTHGKRDPYTMEHFSRAVRSAYSRPAREDMTIQPLRAARQQQQRTEESFREDVRAFAAAGVWEPPETPWPPDSELEVALLEAPPDGDHEEPPPPDAPPAKTKNKEEKYRRTDTGNAERLHRRYGRDISYASDMGKWFVWDGRRWQMDSGSQMARRAIEISKSLFREVANCPTDEERKAMFQWAMKCEGKERIYAMVDLARHMPGVEIAAADLDKHPWLITAINGTIDLRTGRLLAHSREHRITKTLTTTYDPQSECPHWMKFLNLIFSGDQELIRYVQKAVGYSLTGDTSERALFFPYGKGANGKSTFIQTLANLLGEYAFKAPPETIISRDKNAIPNDVAALQGRRFVFVSETEESARLAEAKVKDLTGGETLTARFMRAEFFNFTPCHKLWLETNHKPIIRGTDEAIWDRIKLIPFAVRIPDVIPEQEQLSREEALRRFESEMPGILKWAVDGCLLYQREGLKPPASMTAAATEYREEMDTLGQFLEECTVKSSACYLSAGDLYARFESWCEARGEYKPSQKVFGSRLRERGLPHKRTTAGIVYLDVRLRTDDEIKRLREEAAEAAEHLAQTAAEADDEAVI
jgi:P4 family phage/plasmid primase-like protien